MQTTQATMPMQDVIIRRYTQCKACALWRPAREDSVADDYGFCPRRKYPKNKTHANNGCRLGVRPVE